MESDVYAELKEEFNDKSFVCYQNGICSRDVRPSTLVCINCGEPYHLGCITRIKKEMHHVKGNLITCCSDNNGIISDMTKQINSLKKLVREQEKSLNILKDNNAELLKQINRTNDDDTELNIDLNSKMEINLLRELNQLLREKNETLVNKKVDLQNELLTKKTNQITYAQKLKQVKNSTIVKEVLKIIIKSKDKKMKISC